MAMSQKQRDDRRREKEAKAGVEDLRLKGLNGEKKMVREIMEWIDDTEQASVIMTSIRHMHSLGPDGARAALNALDARHQTNLSGSWRTRFENESRKELIRDPGDQVIGPHPPI